MELCLVLPNDLLQLQVCAKTNVNDLNFSDALEYLMHASTFDIENLQEWYSILLLLNFLILIASFELKHLSPSV